MALDFQPDTGSNIDFQLDFQEDEPKKNRGQDIPGGGREVRSGDKINTTPYESQGLLDNKVGAALETAAFLGSGAAAGPLGVIGGGLSTALDALQGKPTNFRQKADKIAEDLTYQPRGGAAQDVQEALSPALETLQAMGPTGYHAPVHAGTTMSAMRDIREARKTAAAFDAKAAGERVREAMQTEARVKATEPGQQIDMFGGGAKSPIDFAPEPAPSPAPVNKRQMSFNFGEKAPDVITVDKLGEAVRSDVNPNDIAGREAATSRVQAQLDAMLAEEKAKERPNLTSLEDENGQQSLFDQGDQMGQRNQFNAGDLGDWRIDENGMPVRADKSMEAGNVEAPLQRNLFGDELPQTGLEGNNIPITQAIDNTPANGNWAQRRGMTNRLGGNGADLIPGNDLLAAIQEAEGMKFPTIDTSMFDPKAPLPTERLGNRPPEASTPFPELSLAEPGANLSQKPFVPNAADKTGAPIQIDRTVTNESISYTARDAQGNKIGQVFFEQNPDGSLGAGHVQSFEPGKGVAESLYRKAKDDGFTIKPGRAQTEEGMGLVKRLQEKGLIEPGELTPVERHREQVAQVVKASPSETPMQATVLPVNDRPPMVNTIETPRTPELIQAKQEKRQAIAKLPIKDSRLDAFERVSTREEALALAAESGYKDNAPGVMGRNLGSGMNFHAINTNNPLLKFANTLFRDARINAENFSKKYITAKDGISVVWSKMGKEERSQVREALLSGDTHQMQVPTEMMDRVGFSENQKAFVNKYYEANEALFQRWNQVLAEQGLKAVDRREGHVPGIFKGAYKALVTDAQGTKGVIAADSRYQLKAAKEYFAKNHPDYTIVDQGRKGLSDYKNQSDIFSGMNDVLQLLAESDPKFAEVQTMVSEAMKHGNNSIYAFNKHELSKKGVIGNEGNKPWLSADKNTEAWFKSMVQYFEEGAQHHELQRPLNEVRQLANDQSLNMPKTMQYLDEYTKHVTGQNANNPVAGFANLAIDAGPKMVGFGPRQTLQIAGALKNRMSQIFMGWGNYVFTAAQMAQPFQTGLPYLQRAAGALGDHAGAPRSMFNGGNAFMLASLERMTGKDLGNIIPDYMRQAYKYAEDRGIMNFSEMEKAYEGQKSKFMRGVDQLAEVNMKAGEITTRAPMFMSFVDMLHRNGVPLERALPMAENMTQFAMIDYHQWERPPVYSKLGTLGQFAGGLTTFKHGYASQQVRLVKDLGHDANIAKNAAPLGLSVAAAVALAGITGLPFYDELDNIYGKLTDVFADKRMTIRDSFLKNLPEWSKSGAISNAMNIGIQSKFSSANMVPDDLATAASPQLSQFGKVIGDAIDVAKHGDNQSFGNLLMDMVPSTFKGAVENSWKRGPQGQVLNRNNQATVMRSPEDWELRKWTGLRPNKEIIEREADYKARQAEQADTAAKKDISQDFGRKILNNTPITKEDFQKYQKRGGDPKQLIGQFKDRALEKQLTEKQRRDMGVKPTPGSVRKMEYYNKPGER